MPESFDPYRVWLSIPPESRPPTHYQLLGVSPDEHDPTVINAAVMRQSAYVRNFQVGKYAEQAAQILSELQTAKSCLLDRAKRARYDAALPASDQAAARQRYGVPATKFSRSAPPDIDLGELVSLSEPPPGDLLAISSPQAEPVAMLRSGRGRDLLGAWRGSAKLKHSALIWQLPVAFWLGFAFALALAALWPRHAEQTSPDGIGTAVASGAVHAEASEPVEQPLDQTVEGPVVEPAAPRAAQTLPGEVRRLMGHTDSVAALAFLPDGRLVSGSFDTTWGVWDTQTGIAAQRFWPELGHEIAVRAVATSPDGKTALVSNGTRIVHVELPSGKPLGSLYGHRDPVFSVAFSADGRRAASGGIDGTTRLWDLDTRQPIWESSVGSWLYAVTFSRDGNYLMAGVYPDEGGIIRLLDATSGKQVRSIVKGEIPAGGVIGISESVNRNRYLIGFEYLPAVKLFDFESGAEVAQFELGRGQGGCRPTFSPDGRYAAWGNDEELLWLWDINERTKIAELEHAPHGAPKKRRHPLDRMPVAFSPDGKLLASGADDGTIYLWDMAAAVERAATR